MWQSTNPTTLCLKVTEIEVFHHCALLHLTTEGADRKGGCETRGKSSLSVVVFYGGAELSMEMRRNALRQARS